MQHAGENKVAESTSGTKRETAPPVEVPGLCIKISIF